jgi:hypothetical protein
MTFVNGEVQARFMARMRGVDPQRCLAIPVDVGKVTAVALVADHYGEIIVAPFEFALITVARTDHLGFPEGPWSRGYASFFAVWVHIEAGQLDDAAAVAPIC